MQSEIILVSHDRSQLKQWKASLRQWGVPSSHALDAFTALELIEVEKVGGVIARADLPLVSGLTLSRRIKKEHPGVGVILISTQGGGYSESEPGEKVWDLGRGEEAAANLQKVVGVLLLSGGSLLGEGPCSAFLQEDPEFAGIVGRSATIREIFSLILKVRDRDVTVLVEGESGTGKELVARAIHRHSRRADKPFISVNCAALPETLLESELFGHEKGSFTGANSRIVGRFEQADQGCLFLDEIGDMSPATQAKVLRVMEGHEFERVGGRQTIRVDVRIIAATNRDLQRRVTEGTFREDLFYRIGAFPIQLPPLRERMEDLPLVAAHILRNYNRMAAEKITGVTIEALEKMLGFHWPGNIRQLDNFINRAAILAEGGVLSNTSITPEMSRAAQLSEKETPPEEGDSRPSDARPERREEGSGVPFKSLAETEREAIINALRMTGMNVSQAAAGLGISRPTIYKKAKEYGIEITR